MTYNASDYESVPPVITQERFNRILADFYALFAGFTPSGTFVGPYSYVIHTDGTDTYANNAYQLIYGGPDDTGGVDGGDTAAVIQAAIDAVESTGGSILLRSGQYTLLRSLKIDANDEDDESRAIKIWGETLTGDAYFTKTQDEVPLGTVLQPDATHTGSIWDVGYGAAANKGVRNVDLGYMTISGTILPDTDEGSANIVMANTDAGLKITNCQNSVFHHLSLLNCYYGVKMTTSSWTNDGIEFNHDWLGYNYFGFQADGSNQVLTLDHIYSYINYSTGIYVSGMGVELRDIFSNADADEIQGSGAAALRLFTKGFMRGRGIFIQNTKDAVKAGVRGMGLNIGTAGAVMMFDQVVIQGVNGNGVHIYDNNKAGQIFFDHLFCSPSATAYLGGEGDIASYGVYNADSGDVEVHIRDSDLSNCTKSVYGKFVEIENVKPFILENYVSDTIANGNDHKAVTHGLGNGASGFTPNIYTVTPLDSIGDLSYYVSAADTTWVTVNTSAAVGANTDILVYARYKPSISDSLDI